MNIKKIFSILVTIILCLACVSCSTDSPVASSSGIDEMSVTPNPDKMRFENGSYIYRENAATKNAVLEEAKRVLKDYDLESNQVLRFPYDRIVYQTDGGFKLTSLGDAQDKCPNFSIPKKLGDYNFLDLTFTTDLVSVVFPDYIPRPNYKEAAVLHHDEPLDRYLCYKNESTHFRMAIWPNVYADIVSPEEAPAWPSHPEVQVQYCEALSDDDSETSPPSFVALLIPPQTDGGVAFLVHKLSSDDCLESEDLPISEDEAESIYQAVCEGFSK